MEIITVLVATLFNIGATILLAYYNNKRYKKLSLFFQIIKETNDASQRTSELQHKSFAFFMDFIIDLKHYELISLKNALVHQLESERQQEHYETCDYIIEAINHIDNIQNNYKHEQKSQN